MSTAQERNADYWVQRFTEIEDRDYKLSSAYYDRLKRVFKRAEKETKQKLSEWYSRLADNNDITYADAFKLLTADELEEFHWTVQEYIEKGIGVEGNPDWAKQLENASAKVHISRLEEIQTEMRGTVEALYAEYEEGMESLLHGIANDSYYRTAYEVAKGTGIGVTLHRLDTRTLERFLISPWGKDESNFSERIWNRRDKLINTLNDELAQNLILGLDPQKSIDKIAKEFGVDQRAAGRLVMTESAAIGSMAREASLKELGVEEFEVVATLDSHTSDICQAMDGKHFPMSKFEVGVTAPPFHPNCRSTTVPYFDDEFTVDETRAARDRNDEGYERVPSDMTYKEWKNHYVKNDTDISDTIDLPDQNTGGILIKDSASPSYISNLTKMEDVKGSEDVREFVEKLFDSLGIDRDTIPVELKKIRDNGGCKVKNTSDIRSICHYDGCALREYDPRSTEYKIKTGFHESYHAMLEGREWDAFDKKLTIQEYWDDMEETFAEASAHYLTEEYGITKKLAPSYPEKLVRNLPRLKQLKEFMGCETIQDFGKVAFETRRNGGNGVWKKLAKKVRKVKLPKGYQNQYFGFIREHEDELFSMYAENEPGMELFKDTLIKNLHDQMSLVENTGSSPASDSIYFKILACAMQLTGVK